jgi:peptidyl-prolyl cis-trans isomerase A (cyclophilin A)
MKFTLFPLRLFCVAALSVAAVSCGGGLPSTNISADRWMFAKLTTVTVEGPNLDKGISLVAPKCTGIAEVAGGTESLRTFTCTPTAIGPITLMVIGGNVQLRAITLDVPSPEVTMVTSLGDIVLKLDATAAPLTVTNFLQYVNADFYHGLIFHRVIADFMIQGGGYDASLVSPPTRDPIKLELPNGLSNLRGTIAMARTGVSNSATSQFFINAVDNIALDTEGGGYVVFGTVLKGMETVDAIGATPTAAAGAAFANLPITPVVISSVVQSR